jgi:hypothetical protein
MMKKTPPMTAQELMSKLQSDPEYIVRQAQREIEEAETSARFKKEEKPILDDLRVVGLDTESVWSLVNFSGTYPEAIPVLLKHLVLPYSDSVREGIARSLAVREPAVRKAWPLLVEEYCNAPMGIGVKYPGETAEYKLGYKDGLACALSVAVTDETLPKLIELLKDKRHGGSRVLLLSAIRKSKNPLAIQAIEDLADEPDLKIEIASWKKKQKKK